MKAPNDSSVQRRFDGSIDVDHYVAVARRARAEEAQTLGRTIRSALQGLLLRLGQPKPGREAAASAAVWMQGD